LRKVFRAGEQREPARTYRAVLIALRT